MKILKHRASKIGFGVTSMLLLVCAAYLPQHGTAISLYHESIQFVWVDIPPLYVYVELLLVVVNLPAAGATYAVATAMREVGTLGPMARFLTLAGNFIVFAVLQWVAVDRVIEYFRRRRLPG